MTPEVYTNKWEVCVYIKKEKESGEEYVKVTCTPGLRRGQCHCPHMAFMVWTKGKCGECLDLGATENTFYSGNKHFKTIDDKLFIQFYS